MPNSNLIDVWLTTLEIGAAKSQLAVGDPNFQVRRGGGGGGVGQPDPEIRGAVSRKCFFSPSGLILILKGVEGGGGGEPGLGSSPGYAAG